MEIDCIEPDFYYHIYNRGNNRQPIFLDVSHYHKFLKLCEKYLPSCVDILAYCLIPNHFHFLVYIHPDSAQISGVTVSRKISNWFNAYAQHYNRTTDRTGNLFQRPFKRKRITDQDYLKKVIYYIHRNPLHHHLTKKPEDYKFSSYQKILKGHYTFIKRQQVLDWFDGPVHFEKFHQSKFELDSAEFFDD